LIGGPEIDQIEEKTGYPEWLEILRLMEPEHKKEKEATKWQIL